MCLTFSHSEHSILYVNKPCTLSDEVILIKYFSNYLIITVFFVDYLERGRKQERKW